MFRPLGLACAFLAAVSVFAQPPAEWSAYGGGPGGTRFSALDQINREDVSEHSFAWTLRTGAHRHIF